MSRAKALGKARCEVCDPIMHAAAASRFRVEADLRRGVERGEFRMFYQPVVSLEDYRITGFEALLRWQRPHVGTVLPADFISVAEDTGLILPIGKWALREACLQMRIWNQQFASQRMFTVAVNISARQFDQKDLVRGIEEILRETALEPHNLKLELTESMTMRDEERAIEIFRELQSLGVRLCMDDFGTGYSSFRYLRRFGLDVLKIDRSFVSELAENSEGVEIVKALLSLGNSLRMEVIAEGVETGEQVEQLKLLACEYAQGNFFSEPLSQMEATQTLQAYGAHAYAPVRPAASQALSPGPGD
jgi:EAL domain-containing protein (putative c-di-GMP-specific phosphodiesterase class I)